MAEPTRVTLVRDARFGWVVAEEYDVPLVVVPSKPLRRSGRQSKRGRL